MADEEQEKNLNNNQEESMGMPEDNVEPPAPDEAMQEEPPAPEDKSLGDDDEYHFEDLESLGTDSDSFQDDTEYLGEVEEGATSSPGRGRFDALDPKVLTMIRNGAIAVGGLIVIVIAYKYITSFSSKDASKAETKSAMTSVVPQTQTSPKVVESSQPVSTGSLPSFASSSSSASSEPMDVSALKQDQKKMEAELSAMTAKLNNVTQKMGDISNKLDSVSQTMLVLNERFERQSQQMARMRTLKSQASRPKPKVAVKQAVYYIQAVIPGRAWLKSDEGKVLTVNRGTEVPGYGAVRGINPKLGRIYTSSGRVIRYSEADS